MERVHGDHTHSVGTYCHDHGPYDPNHTHEDNDDMIDSLGISGGKSGRRIGAIDPDAVPTLTPIDRDGDLTAKSGKGKKGKSGKKGKGQSGGKKGKSGGKKGHGGAYNSAYRVGTNVLSAKSAKDGMGDADSNAANRVGDDVIAVGGKSAKNGIVDATDAPANRVGDVDTTLAVSGKAAKEAPGDITDTPADRVGDTDDTLADSSKTANAKASLQGSIPKSTGRAVAPVFELVAIGVVGVALALFYQRRRNRAEYEVLFSPVTEIETDDETSLLESDTEAVEFTYVDGERYSVL